MQGRPEHPEWCLTCLLTIVGMARTAVISRGFQELEAVQQHTSSGFHSGPIATVVMTLNWDSYLLLNECMKRN